MKRHLVWLVLPLFLMALTVLATFLPREDRALLSPSPQSWKVSGNFRGGIPPRELVYSTEGDNYYWIVDRYTGDGSGRLESAPFVAPEWVSIMVRGDLTKPMNQVYFRLVDEDKQQAVRAIADIHWRRTTHWLPADWVGKRAQLVAVAGPRERYNSFGIGSPRAVGTGSLLALKLESWTSLPAFGISLLLFLSPGIPVATWLVRRRVLASFMLLPMEIVFSCAAGYLVFWAYFWSVSFGLVFGLTILVGNAGLLVFDLSPLSGARSPILSPDVLRPLGLMALVGAFFLTLLQTVQLSVPFEVTPRIRFLEFTLAVDNELPFLFADALYDQRDPRQIVKGWQSSDRPPLQAGVLLLQMPLFYRTAHPKDYALIASIAVQCAWVPAVLALWKAAGLTGRRAGFALLFVTFTGFALVNSVYTWPKMLSAALVVTAVILGFFDRSPKEQGFPLSRAFLLGLASALAALGHAGVAFTLLALGLFLLLPRYYPGWSRLACGAAVFLVCLLTWTAYQRYYDPPGDRLLRQHLASDTSPAQHAKPLLENLRSAYGRLRTTEIIENKLENLRMLIMASREYYRWPAASKTPVEWPTDAIGFRRCDFLCLFWSLGLTNLGWLIALAATWRGRPAWSLTLGFVVPGLALAVVATWVLLMFGRASTIVHQGSYATMLLLFASLAAWLTTLPGKLPYFLLTLQGLVFAIGWLFTSPANQFGVPNILMIPCAVFFFVALVKACVSGAE